MLAELSIHRRGSHARLGELRNKLVEVVAEDFPSPCRKDAKAPDPLSSAKAFSHAHLEAKTKKEEEKSSPHETNVLPSGGHASLHHSKSLTIAGFTKGLRNNFNPSASSPSSSGVSSFPTRSFKGFAEGRNARNGFHDSPTRTFASPPT